MAPTFSGSRLVSLITVRDMDRAIQFYTRTLGGKLLYRGEGGMKDSWAGITVGGADAWLITPVKREKRTMAYHTFMVPDISAAVAELKGKGVKFQRAEKMSKETRVEGPIAWEPFGGSAFFKDSEGNLLMVWQNIPPM